MRWAFVFFLVSSGFCLGTVPWMPFSLFLIVESWTLTLIEASEACSSLDVVLGSFMTSWMSRQCVLGVILVGQPLLGRFTTVPSFLHLWIMALTVVLRNGFIKSSQVKLSFIVIPLHVWTYSVYKKVSGAYREKKSVLLQVVCPAHSPVCSTLRIAQCSWGFQQFSCGACGVVWWDGGGVDPGFRS